MISQELNTEVFEKYESKVRHYCRKFSDVFDSANGALIHALSGRTYIDFFAGAGSLNYGHNPAFIKSRIIEYIEANGIISGLDLFTQAKANFINVFQDVILKERNLDYRLQFCGPTGTNAVEAALKLARKVKNRSSIISFMGGYHGVSLGSLSVTGSVGLRKNSSSLLGNCVFVPYADGGTMSVNSIQYLAEILSDPMSGVDKPAAIICETIQAEGGVHVAPEDWLIDLKKLCERHDILLICDEIQVGCYRSGRFFSFERAGIEPDIVILSKSISGFGTPMSMLLMKPELDIWETGEHSGTFRGNQLGFVGGAAAIEHAKAIDLESIIEEHAAVIKEHLSSIKDLAPDSIAIRGIGMIWGIDLRKISPDIADLILKRCFEMGLIIETVGRGDSVIKLLPPVNIDSKILSEGLEILKAASEIEIEKAIGG